MQESKGFITLEFLNSKSDLEIDDNVTNASNNPRNIGQITYNKKRSEFHCVFVWDIDYNVVYN